MPISLKMLTAAAIYLILFTGCALISNPEKSGGEIIAVPDGPWCSFNISGDGRWLQYIGDYSDYQPDEERRSLRQRQAWFVNLDTGETEVAKPDPEVVEMLRDGLGPDGMGCFSPDNSRVYFTRVIFPGERTRANPENENGQTQPEAAMSVPSQRAERYYYMMDLNRSPLTIERTDQSNCSETVSPVKPNIRVEQRSEKRIRVYSSDGMLLATHRPRGLLSKRISMWNLDSNQWEQSYYLSPDGSHLAYIVYETGPLGFSAPTPGYLADLNPKSENPAKFLAASTYSAAWSSRNHLFACTSHSSENSVIARWIP